MGYCLQLNRGQLGGPSGEDINVLPVWKQGVTGRGVTVVVVDTGKDTRYDCHFQNS